MSLAVRELALLRAVQAEEQVLPLRAVLLLVLGVGVDSAVSLVAARLPPRSSGSRMASVLGISMP